MSTAGQNCRPAMAPTDVEAGVARAWFGPGWALPASMASHWEAVIPACRPASERKAALFASRAGGGRRRTRPRPGIVGLAGRAGERVWKHVTYIPLLLKGIPVKQAAGICITL
jgi:hypothetical protein